MARTKQVSKRKRRRIGLPALGAAGVSLVMAGGAAANAPTTNVPSLQDASSPTITLDEEEIADVSLGTFYVFDKENDSRLGQGIRLAARGGCGRCGGCAAARCGGCAGKCAVARCAGRCGCAARCGGCGGCGGGWWGIAPAVGLGLGLGLGAGCWRWTPRGWVWVCY
jgi:hypothetical protein